MKFTLVRFQEVYVLAMDKDMLKCLHTLIKKEHCNSCIDALSGQIRRVLTEKESKMQIYDVLRQLKPFAGDVREDQLGQLVFRVAIDNEIKDGIWENGKIVVDGVVRDVEFQNIVGARWKSAGEKVEPKQDIGGTVQKAGGPPTNVQGPGVDKTEGPTSETGE